MLLRWWLLGTWNRSLKLLLTDPITEGINLRWNQLAHWVYQPTAELTKRACLDMANSVLHSKEVPILLLRCFKLVIGRYGRSEKSPFMYPNLKCITLLFSDCWNQLA